MADEDILDPWVEKWMAENPVMANPLEEFTPERETAIAALLKDAARKASLQLGHGSSARAAGARA